MVGIAGGTPAFPAQRVLGARASRSHGGRNALLGNAASKHARKKPYPFKREWGGILHAQEFVNSGSAIGIRFPPASRGNRTQARFPSRSGGEPKGLKGVGFFRACLLAALPSRAFLLPCERDARAPSTRCAGNAGVPPAIPTTREKNYPSNTNRAAKVHKNEYAQ